MHSFPLPKHERYYGKVLNCIYLHLWHETFLYSCACATSLVFFLRNNHILTKVTTFSESTSKIKIMMYWKLFLILLSSAVIYKSYEIVFHASLVCSHYIVQYGFIKVCIFWFFWKSSFFVFLRFLCFLPVLFHYLHSSRCHVLCFVFTYFKQFFKIDIHHKNLIIAFNKKHGSRELLSFWDLKRKGKLNENVEHLQTDRVKKRYQQI